MRSTRLDGFGIDPNPHCGTCEGRGFYYLNGWAKTCACKIERQRQMQNAHTQ